MATIKEIANRVGVSNATVSRVLNHDNKISVSGETKELIFKVAEELNYKKKKIYAQINNVALLYWAYSEEALEDGYYKSICSEMELLAKERNIKMTKITKDRGIKTVTKDFDSFIAIGWFSKKEVDYLKKITKVGVFVDTSPDESVYDSVRPNLDSMVTQIMDYFYKNNHRNIGFIGISDFDINTLKPVMDVREWSFRESSKYYNIYNEKNIFITDKINVHEGYKIAIKMIDELKEELPSAICIASDTLAVGALQAFNERGIAVPSRVAVFSINDIPVSKYLSPPLSTFHIDITTIGETALNLLREQVIKKRKITKTIFINGRPVFRKSC